MVGGGSFPLKPGELTMMSTVTKYEQHGHRDQRMNFFLVAVATANCYNLPPDQCAYYQAIELQEIAYCYRIQSRDLYAEGQAILHQEPGKCDCITGRTIAA